MSLSDASNTDIDRLTRITLIILIVAWSLQLLYPLLGILAWGFILAVIMHPFYKWLNTRMNVHSLIAASCITFCLLLFLAVIAFFITNDIARTATVFSKQAHSTGKILPGPPAAIQHWPLVGEPIYQFWSSASADLQSFIKNHSDTLIDTGKYFFEKLISTSKNFIFFIIAILFSGFLLAYSNNSVTVIRKLAKRIAPKNGANIINMIRGTIQNVSRGVIGIALLQSILFAILMLIANVPGVSLLSFLALLLSIIQVGLLFLVIPIIIYLFYVKSLALALVISALLLLDSFLDTLLKPIVFARGLTTPMMIIFIGVVSGILVYGLIGVFIGPIVLSIAYNLMDQWINS